MKELALPDDQASSMIETPAADLPVAANHAVPGVSRREEHATRRGAHRGPRVELSELAPVGGQTIDVRRLDLLLTVAAELGAAAIGGELDSTGRKRRE